MKHTKGKWSISESGNQPFKLCISAEDGGSVCHITNWPEAEANAKLISKAPEMLEALQSIVESYSLDQCTEIAIKIIKEIES